MSINTMVAPSNPDQEVKNDLVSDIEDKAVAEGYLANTSVASISWENITVNVKDRETKLPKSLVKDVSGLVRAGTSAPSCVDACSRPRASQLADRTSQERFAHSWGRLDVARRPF